MYFSLMSTLCSHRSYWFPKFSPWFGLPELTCTCQNWHCWNYYYISFPKHRKVTTRKSVGEITCNSLNLSSVEKGSSRKKKLSSIWWKIFTITTAKHYLPTGYSLSVTQTQELWGHTSTNNTRWTRASCLRVPGKRKISYDSISKPETNDHFFEEIIVLSVCAFFLPP